MSDSILSKPLTRESVDMAIGALESRIMRVEKALKADPTNSTAMVLNEALAKDKAALLEIRASIE